MKEIFPVDKNSVAVLPTIIKEIDDMEKVAAEMKEFARTHPHDYKATTEAVLKAPHLEAEKDATGLLHVRGYDEMLQKYNRFIVFPGWLYPIQLTWVENVVPEGIVQQLTVLDYGHRPLESEMIRCLAAFFWDFDNKPEWKSVRQVPGTPLYAAVLARLVSHDA